MTLSVVGLPVTVAHPPPTSGVWDVSATVEPDVNVSVRKAAIRQVGCVCVNVTAPLVHTPPLTTGVTSLVAGVTASTSLLVLSTTA